MRTNKLFTVTVCKYATMAVEADDPQQAMNIAKQYKDTHLTDRDFADSNIDVYSCEAYGCSLDDMCLKPSDRVYASNEVLTTENYRRELNGEENQYPQSKKTKLWSKIPNFPIKREQSHACMSYAECEESQT